MIGVMGTGEVVGGDAERRIRIGMCTLVKAVEVACGVGQWGLHIMLVIN